MKYFSLYLRCFALLACCVTLAACLSAQKRSQWTTLFDGTDLDHWVVVEGGEWSIEDGVLVGRNGQNWTTNPEKTGSWLRSKRMYSDFELELEYAISENGNSGVFFRAGPNKNPAFTGYEMQITDCHGRDVSKYNAGIYDVVGPSKNMAKPAGEWNHAMIRAVGHTITITLNGETIVEHVGDRRLRGYIGLQNHDDRAVIKFRNVRVREL